MKAIKRDVAVILLYTPEKKILFQHRAENARRSPGFWGFFGGGINLGETPEQAVTRECAEELVYHLKNPRRVMIKDIISGYKGKMYVFMEEYNSTKGIQLQEGKGFAWLSCDEFLSLDKIILHDKETIEYLKDKF